MISKKTFLIINQTAGSPYHGMVYRNYYLAKEWVKEGHRAIIISGSYFHNFKSLPEVNGFFTREVIDGVEYWWVKLPKYSQSRSIGRFISIFLFPFLLFFFPFWKLGKPDSIIVSGPPHISIINGWFWAKLWGSSLIYEVRDIWPLTIVKLGRINPMNPAIILFSIFERFAYKISDKVVSVLRNSSDYFVSKGLKRSKFSYLPNGVDLDSIKQLEGNVYRKVLEIKNTKKIIIYAGSLGIANNLDQFIDSAKILEYRNDIQFVLVGDGPHRAALLEKSKNLKNVSMFQSVPKNEIFSILSLADVGYIGLLKSDLFKHGVSPNKLFDYMAVGLPVVMAIDTDDNIVENAACGRLVRSCEPSEISSTIEDLLKLDFDERKKMGENGRSFIENNHDYKILAKKYLMIMSELKQTLSSQIRFEFNYFIESFFLLFSIGLMFYFILPHFFPSYFELGITKLLKDQFKFHKIAVEFASHSWREFSFRPMGQFPAGILALLYKLTGIHKPFVMLPILSALGSLSICGTISILRNLGVSGRWWPLLIGVFFTITPTSISWIIYPHKDSFIVPGIILIAWSTLGVFLNGARTGHYISILIGMFLVLINKPYFSEILLVNSVLLIIVASFKKYFNPRRIIFLFFSALLFLVVVLGSKGYLQTRKSQPKKNQYFSKKIKDQANKEKPRQQYLKDNWNPIFGIDFLDDALLSLAYTRERFLFQYSHGKTNYFPEIKISSSSDALKYIPRSLILTFFEPLPWRFNRDDKFLKELLFSLLKLEMIVSYFLIFVLLFSLRDKKINVSLIVFLCISTPFLIAFGFAVPNIGTINRYRFPFLLLIKLAGFAALWNSNRLKWPGRLLMWVDPPENKREKKKVLFLVPDDETFLIQRLVMAKGVQAAGFDVHVAAEETGAAQKIRDLGFTFHRLDLNRGGLNPLADFWPFIKLVFFLAKERPDILQCVSIKPVLYGATAGTIVGLKRIVCLINGLGYAFEGENLKGKIVKIVAMALYRNALALPGIRVIFQNPDDREYFVSHRLAPLEKTILIRGSGVDMMKFPPHPLPINKKPKILFVGRLLWSKGIGELVDAAINLKNEGLDFTLQIVGSPDDRNPNAVSTEFINKFKDKDFIEWPGRQCDMPTFYREADILCLPTKYKEGIPLTLLEAASMGRALVATDVPGCREIVRNEVNGFLIPPGNTTELTNALRKLILNPDQRIVFGENSSKIVKDEFSSEIIQRELNQVYFDLLESILDKKDDLCLATS
jgi:glycosyltransferase involved in cell wall biosynthesis